MKYTPTIEQNNIIDYVINNDGITLIEASAGCAKTSTSEMLIRKLRPSKGLYTAFNKAIVVDGVSTFRGTNVECKTLHALAHSYVNPKGNIGDLSYTCITENIEYYEKAKIINTIDQFYVSASTNMESYFENSLKSYPKLVPLCVKYVDLMIEGTVAPTFNFLLKYFHLMLVEGAVCEYDIVILDEINDVTAVTLEIFKLIQSPKKLGLGESHQAIYQFLNLVDGFKELKDTKRLPLTKSFRCSVPIASAIQDFMNTSLTTDFIFTGNEYKPCQNGKELYVTITNASIIEEIYKLSEVGKGFTLLRKPSEIFACPLAIITAGAGKAVYNKKYKFLEKEYQNYCKSSNRSKGFHFHLRSKNIDDEVNGALTLLQIFRSKGINIWDLYNTAKNSKPNPKYTCATAFTAKGLEFETVTISDCLNSAVTKVLKEDSSERETTLRIYYVACSRAGTTLHNADHLNL